MPRIVAGALLAGAAVAGGLWLAQQLSSPVSDVRLWWLGVSDRLKRKG